MYFKLLTCLGILKVIVVTVHSDEVAEYYKFFKDSLFNSVQEDFLPEIFPTHLIDHLPGNLCCSFKDRYSVLKFSGKRCNHIKSDSNDTICCHFKSVQRKFRGNYTCLVYMNKTLDSSIRFIDVLYPPTFDEIPQIFLYDASNKPLICPVKSGNPANHTFVTVWEHRSLFNEHIRYLNGTENGSVHIPRIQNELLYQNAGIYVCGVQNGVPDKYENVVQYGHVSVKYAGPPVILDIINQSGPILFFNTSANLEINIFTESSLTWAILFSNNTGKSVHVLYKKQNSTTSFHGKMIQIEVYQIVIQHKEDGTENNQHYELTVGNEFGNTTVIINTSASTKTGGNGIPIIYPVLAIMVVAQTTFCIVLWVRRQKQ